jgi:two-component system, cell cycle sensor histidine kinase and response regulator CckA
MVKFLQTERGTACAAYFLAKSLSCGMYMKYPIPDSGKKQFHRYLLSIWAIMMLVVGIVAVAGLTTLRAYRHMVTVDTKITAYQGQVQALEQQNEARRRLRETGNLDDERARFLMRRMYAQMDSSLSEIKRADTACVFQNKTTAVETHFRKLREMDEQILLLAEQDPQAAMAAFGTPERQTIGQVVRTDLSTLENAIEARMLENFEAFGRHLARIMIITLCLVGLVIAGWMKIARKLREYFAGQMEARDTMRESEEKYRTLVETLPNAVVIYRNGRILFANPAAAVMVGRAVDEDLADSVVTDFIAESEQERILSFGTTRLENESQAPKRYRTAMKRANGEEFPVEVSAGVTMFKGQRANQLVVSDMTEWERAERILRESEAKYRMLVDALPHAVVIIRADRILYVNPATHSMFGYPLTDNIVGRNPFLFAAESERARLMEIATARLNGDLTPPSSYVTRMSRRDGDEFPAEMHSTLVQYEGAPAIQLVVMDITERKKADDKLRESEERFRSLSDNAPVLIWMGGLHWHSFYFNRSFLDFTGSKVAGLYGEGWKSLVHPEDLSRIMDTYDKAFSAQRTFCVEFRLRHADGTYHWVLATASPRRTAEGSFAGYIGTYVDITERRLFEESLRESEQRHKAIYNETPVMMHSIDHDGRLVGVSDYWTETMGYTREEVLGRKSTEFLTAESQRYARDVILPEFYKMGVCTNVPYQFVKKSGEVMDVLLSATSERDAEGNFVRSLAVVVDVTERKMIVQALREREELYRGLTEASPDAIAMIDPSGVIQWGNTQKAKLLGCERPEEVVGRHVLDIIAPEDREQVQNVMFQLLNGTESAQLEYHLLQRDGTQIMVETHVRTLPKEDGGVLGCIAVSRDVTAERLAETELREREDRYRIIAEQTGQLLYDWDMTTGNIQWAGAIEKITGFSPQEFEATDIRQWEEMIHPEDRAQAMEALQSMSADDGMFHVEYRFRRHDGSYAFVEDTGVVQHDDRGKAYRMLGSMKDISERMQGEVLRAASEHMFRTVLDTVPVRVFWKDKNLTYIGCNRAFAADLGLTSPKEIIGKSDFDLSWSGQADRIRDVDKSIIECGAPIIGVEERRTWSDDEIHWLRLCKVPLKDTEGRTIGVLGTYEDITEHRQAEDSLRLAHAELQAVFYAIPDLLFRIKSDGTVSGLWSGPKGKLYVPASEFLGKRFSDVLPPDVGNLLMTGIQQVAETKRPVEVEYELTIADDRSYFEAQIAPLADGEEVVVVRDISARKRAEQVRSVLARISEASATTDRLEDFLEAMRVCIGDLVDTHNFYVAIYNDAEDTYSFPCFADEYDEMAPTPMKLPRTLTDYVRRTGAPLLCDHDTFRRLGEAGEVELLGTDSLTWMGIPLRTTQGVLGVMAMQSYHNANLYDAQDLELLNLISGHVAMAIQRRRALDALIASEAQLRQAQKMEAIGRLAGGVAHDFNNVLTSILGYSELTLMKTTDGGLRDNIEQVIKAAQRAASLTRQLLAFSRKQVLQPRALNLNETIADMEKMVRRLIGEDVELTTHFQSNLGSVKADPNQIEQVLLNLAVNARDAMPEGGKITITTENVELDDVYLRDHPDVTAGPYVMLSVTDNGCGMSRDVQSRIFEPFYTTKEQGKGTGLGLATVYGIVKQSGGCIHVYSEEGRGTTFKVFLPRVDEVPETTDEAVSQGTLAGQETVLLVEDDEAVRRIVRELLEREGYLVLEAAGAGSAMQMERDYGERIDVLLSDVIMPQISGDALARYLTGSRPDLKVLLMSGYTDDSIFRRGLDHSAAFLSKPFTAEKLLRTLRDVLDIPAKPSGEA